MKPAILVLAFALTPAVKLFAQAIASGAVIRVETSPADKPRGYFGAKLDELPTIGEQKDGALRIVAVGAVRTPAIHYIKVGSSLADAFKSGIELSSLATSRFIILRDDKLIRIDVGASHGVAPIAKDVLPLIHLQDGDVIYVYEVSPY